MTRYEELKMENNISGNPLYIEFVERGEDGLFIGKAFPNGEVQGNNTGEVVILSHPETELAVQ